MSDAGIVADIVNAMPKLRVYALKLCHGVQGADDLVQDTVARALAGIGTFQPESNLMAWLYAIERNHFIGGIRKRQREVDDPDGKLAAFLPVQPVQVDRIQCFEVAEALDRLTPVYREAVLLVAVDGMAYGEAAERCGCAVGTMKSRVNRARARLSEATG